MGIAWNTHVAARDERGRSAEAGLEVLDDGPYPASSTGWTRRSTGT